MTYLEIVNKVLVRLREGKVSTVSQTAYSEMVGAFVNDAKTVVEAAWDWGALRSILPIATVDSQSTYSLTDFGERGRILSMWNDTHNWEMTSRKQKWFDRRNQTQEVLYGDPKEYTYRANDGSGDPQIELYPVPNDVQTINVSSFIPQADLENDSDTLTVPWLPVVLMAVALLTEESGETGGMSLTRRFELANDTLSDSVVVDASRYSTEEVWYEV